MVLAVWYYHFIPTHPRQNFGYLQLLLWLKLLSLKTTQSNLAPAFGFGNVQQEKPLSVGHSITIVGYSDSQNAFLARNTWGPFFNGNGHVWFPYQHIENRLFWEIWTLFFNGRQYLQYFKMQQQAGRWIQVYLVGNNCNISGCCPMILRKREKNQEFVFPQTNGLVEKERKKNKVTFRKLWVKASLISITYFPSSSLRVTRIVLTSSVWIVQGFFDQRWTSNTLSQV